MDLNKLIGELGSADAATVYKARRALLEALKTGADTIVPGLTEAFAAVKETEEKQGKNAVKVKRPAHSVAVRRELAALLADWAGAKAVPALEAALSDLDLRDNARAALQQISGDEATKALLGAAEKGLGSEFLAGVFGALSRRPGAEVAAALKKAITDSPEHAAKLAAAQAASHHADPSLDEAIAGLTKIHGDRAVRARLQLADTLAAAGKREDARRVAQAVAASDAGDAQKKAAANLLKRWSA